MAKQEVLELLRNPNFTFRSERQAKFLEELGDCELVFGSVTVYIRVFKFNAEIEEVRVNWSAMGSVDLETARLFTKDMIKATDFAERVEAAFRGEN